MTRAWWTSPGKMSKIEEVVVGPVGYTAPMGSYSTSPRPNEGITSLLMSAERQIDAIRGRIMWDEVPGNIRTGAKGGLSMQNPITTIDLGHSSSPDAVATPWEETRRVLETAEVFWLATVRADGRPHVTPIAAAWLDRTLYFGTGSIEQKLKNLRGNPQVVLTTGCNHLASGLDIVVEGDAAPVTDPAVHERFYQQQAILWGEGWPIQLRDGVLWDEPSREPLLLFAVTPTKIFAYARGDQWSQTRYQF